MIYDEDLLVELIAGGEVSQTEIAERVGVSRRTVWRIAHGYSRPDLQQKIADTVEGYRQETIRLAARFMKPLLKKQIEVALEGDGETARKCREFLLKTFLLAAPEQAAKRLRLATTPSQEEPEKHRDSGRLLDPVAMGNSLAELSPELKDQVVAELGGPDEERPSTTPLPEDTDVEEATLRQAQGLTAATPPDDLVSDDKGKKPGKKPFDPFAQYVDGPHGTKVNVHALALEREYLAEIEADKDRPPRRRVPRVPRE